MGTPPWIPLNLFKVIYVLFKEWKVIRVFREYLFDSRDGDKFPKEVGIYAMLRGWRALRDSNALEVFDLQPLMCRFHLFTVISVNHLHTNFTCGSLNNSSRILGIWRV